MNNKDMPVYPVSEELTDRIDAGIKIYYGLTKLEAFTMAALKGLCANLSIKEATDQDVKAAGMMAVEIAARTLTEIEWKELHNDTEAALAELNKQPERDRS